jgi:hypothetical protein
MSVILANSDNATVLHMLFLSPLVDDIRLGLKLAQAFRKSFPQQSDDLHLYIVSVYSFGCQEIEA